MTGIKSARVVAPKWPAGVPQLVSTMPRKTPLMAVAIRHITAPRVPRVPVSGRYTPDAQVLGERNCAQALELARNVVCYKCQKLCHRACHMLLLRGSGPVGSPFEPVVVCDVLGRDRGRAG
jgi:hypothetical protein